MLREITAWVLFCLLFIEGVYLKVLLSRSDFGHHGTNIACPTLLLMYTLCSITFIISLLLFFKTKPPASIYSAYLIASSVMLMAFFIMTITDTVTGIGNGVEGSVLNYFCPTT